MLNRSLGEQATDLAGANLLRTDLRGVDLREVIGLRPEQIERAIVDENTKLPGYATGGENIGQISPPGSQRETSSPLPCARRTVSTLRPPTTTAGCLKETGGFKRRRRSR